jgi:peptidoglycan/LPS O-acetylase OafA/YrhL
MRGRGVISLLVLVMSWLALDDITTDNANGFPLEYSFLVLAGVWFTAQGAWLIGRRQMVAGIGSLAAVAIGVVAFWSLPHHHQPASFVNELGYVPLAWFAGLTIWFLVGRTQLGGGERRSLA